MIQTILLLSTHSTDLGQSNTGLDKTLVQVLNFLANPMDLLTAFSSVSEVTHFHLLYARVLAEIIIR